ncbi:protein-glutamate O-methyltransferase CheR [Paenibacillus sp. FSL H7-0331]|uniref:CheR family methyltransferase n=1 Tax=Paenibacillus sp. FSL H7-0331 TaxID=1920421 RepID=UPI00096BE257|nr:protein-glutamate O-methyltransferase CheR [Paenibacillus sp. FSL H7-0331]OMF18691.1 chemotaxis protein CheR [Paenibacillus sp. FSL H7-0331]
MSDKISEKIEIDLLLDAIFLRHGYDFRNYARSSLMRRLHYIKQKNGLTYISDMIPKVLYDEAFTNQLLLDLSVTVTEMFRDPEFFAELRKQVIPLLMTYPFVKIWHAGCATGEEVYSMAILLEEEGFYDRVQIYATDINQESLHIAQEGIYSLENIRKFTSNYQKSGGKSSFSDYYHAKYQMGKINEDLKRNIVFSQHNLATDQAFGEMHLIVCRNVLIYFDKQLQNQVFRLFNSSLVSRGFLCIGSKESIEFSDIHSDFETLSCKWRIFRKQLPK